MNTQQMGAFPAQVSAAHPNGFMIKIVRCRGPDFQPALTARSRASMGSARRPVLPDFSHMLRAVEFSHQLLRERLFPGDMAIDATAGNGHDTHFLAQLTGPEGMVFAFDVQGGAIAATRSLLERWGVPAASWQLIQAGHETMGDAIPAAWHGRAGAVLFNLGYLPGSDKSIVTAATTTVTAMRAALTLLRPGGILVAVLYTGHPGGADEAQAVMDFCAGLPTREYHAIEYRTLNFRSHPPSVIAIEKAGADLEPEYSI